VERHIGELAALATAFCWTIGSLAFEAAGKRIGSLTANLIRLVLAFVFLAGYGWFVRGLPVPSDATAHMWLWLSLSGFVGFFIGDMALFEAFVRIGPRVSMLMMALAPPFTAIIGWLVLGEQLTLQDWAGMIVTVTGICLVVWERPGASAPVTRPVTRFGLFLGLVAAAGQAIGLVLSKLGMNGYDAFAATQIRVIAGTLAYATLFLFINWWPRVFASFRHRSGLGFTALGAFVGPFVGVGLSLVAVKHVAAGVAATIISIVPVLIIPFVIVIHHEHVSWRATLGALVAVTGVGMIFL
jgi:drug/metabolite transporter (DMT)-like permease